MFADSEQCAGLCSACVHTAHSLHSAPSERFPLLLSALQSNSHTPTIFTMSSQVHKCAVQRCDQPQPTVGHQLGINAAHIVRLYLELNMQPEI
ncbi:hypothetical protein OE88DRAFT_173035 [Heliocybe sulcata]|uniref:Uncharacterized protein n=1 Tax=Heliocybe sulcata TaxID=5364 RepID=A0A5C3MZ31_9AGAM|nr:hypothetical protein OE88DRAFT_173035 [Heliocybe sulcata]